MLPSKPPEVSDEDWVLELPSILGSAHPDFHGPAETPSPRSLISVESDSSTLQLPSSPRSTVLYAADTPPQTPRSSQAAVVTSVETPFLEWNIPATHTELTLDVTTLAPLPPPLEQEHQAEHLAHFFIQTGKASFQDISRLLDLLPEKTSAKRRGPLSGWREPQVLFHWRIYFLPHHGRAEQCNPLPESYSSLGRDYERNVPGGRLRIAHAST